jgi:hypothetical protein
MIFKPLKLAAILERGTQSRLVDLAIERHERIACAAFKQDFHSRQHRVDAPAGALAKLAMTFVEGMPAATQETRDVLLVHRNQMIEQGFMRFDQKADQHGRAGLRCKTLDGLHIVSPRQLR